MFANATDWLLLVVDVSLKAVLLAVFAGIGLKLFRVSNEQVRHRVWTATLCGMLLMPVLVQCVPGLTIAVPSLAVSGRLDDSVPSVQPDLVPNGPTPESALSATVESEMANFRAATTTAKATDVTLIVNSSTAPEQPTLGSGVQSSAAPVREVSGEGTTFGINTFSTAMLSIYVAITAALFLRLLIGIASAGWLVRRSSPVKDEAGRLPASARGVVRETSLLTVPVTIGVLRPRVLLPAEWRSWSTDKLDAVLQHELSHIARRDYAVNLLAEFNRCLYWFHPLAWWLTRKLSDLAERACDDAVIASTGNRTSYARHLLDIAASAVASKRRCVNAGVSMARSADVETRINAILDSERPLAKRPSWKTTVFVAAISLPVLWFAAALRAENLTPAETQSDVKASKPGANDAASANASAKVTGRVVDEQGQPIAGADVSLVLYSHERNYDRNPAPDPKVWATSTTDNTGRFTLPYAAISDPDFYTKRAHRLVTIAHKSGLALGWKYVDFANKKTNADITLAKPQVRRGKLVGLEGQAIAGATIHVVGVGKAAPRWMQFRQWPIHNGMPMDEVTDTVIPVDQDEKLWPHLIQFRHPPFGVKTWLKSVTSDKDGGFEIKGLGPDHIVELHVYGTDQAGSKAHRLDVESQTKPTTLVLDTPRTITGLVTDKVSGQPVAGAVVRVDGTVLIMAKIPIVADWKGRQDHVGNMHALQHNNSMFDGPTAEARTDKNGRYQVRVFGPRYGQPNFVLSVLSPADKPYLSTKKWIAWPRKAVPEQVADIQLLPGVRVSGQVVSAEGRPVPRARIDFWSRDLPYPFENVSNPLRGFKIGPEGVQHPHWRKADRFGRFEIIVPHGESHLFINQGTDETVVDRVNATEVGLTARETRVNSPFTSFLPPQASVEPHRFYPDRAVRLKYTSQTADEVTVQLHKRAPTLTVHVVNPDGTPAKDLTYLAGQPPFRYYALRLKRLIQKSGDDTFTVPCRDLTRPVSLAFLSADGKLGLHQEFAAGDITDTAITLKLKPLGEAQVRFVDKAGKPLPGFRPLMWMSIPSKPFSTAIDLEKQTVAKDPRLVPLQQSFDSVWTSLLHTDSHGSLKTDANGNATFKSLVPGATYRLTQFDGKIKDFRVEPGQSVNLGDVVIHDSDGTKQLPAHK